MNSDRDSDGEVQQGMQPYACRQSESDPDPNPEPELESASRCPAFLALILTNTLTLTLTLTLTSPLQARSEDRPRKGGMRRGGGIAPIIAATLALN